MRTKLTLLALVAALGALPATAQDPAKPAMPADHTMFSPGDIQWQAGPPSLPPGAKFAVLDGDPTKEGIVTFRLSAPAGYRIPPHWHPAFERVTVISGTAGLGMGDAFDKAKGHTLQAGGFIALAPRSHHFFWAESDTIVQVHAQGPWQIYYVNPADDPRQAKK